ncbi:UNKNOWN [Stylonychia lemnae]|uniref:Uncharacterized protein n=1 Tax=Stylonychia lemnae TaxID=5949 RepID=A0A078A707_STYLE|nr:UNKNOWN [Stylonychia lemnae]|eukprot:CDW76561.1 UNKNOWN [Stylonychia lemnae]
MVIQLGILDKKCRQPCQEQWELKFESSLGYDKQFLVDISLAINVYKYPFEHINAIWIHQ